MAKIRARLGRGYEKYRVPFILGSAPLAPSDFTATSISSTASFTWTDNSDDEVDFELQRKLESDPDVNYATTEIFSADAESGTDDNGMVTGTPYTWRLRARNAFGESSWSSTVSGPPAKPTGLSVTSIGSTAANLAWTDNSGNETGFRVQYKLGKVTTWTNGPLVGVNVDVAQVTGLSPNLKYNFRVKATGTPSDSLWSNTATATTGPPGTPDPPIPTT